MFDNRFPAFEVLRGASEVVLYTDDHDAFGTLAPERAEALMWVWRQRYEELGARDDVDYVFIFENRGVEVGVTLHHPHGQIYGFPSCPPCPRSSSRPTRAWAGAPSCRANERELATGGESSTRTRTSWPTSPTRRDGPTKYTLCMREHRPSLSPASPPSCSMLSGALQLPTCGLRRAVLQAVPVRDGRPPGADREPTIGRAIAGGLRRGEACRSHGRGWGRGHLHAEFYPPLRTADKLKYPAGSEQGAGTFISDVFPEHSAVAW